MTPFALDTWYSFTASGTIGNINISGFPNANVAVWSGTCGNLLGRGCTVANAAGNAFIGVTHRLDRPVSGLVVFAKTSKALSRLNEMFKNSEVKKTYWAVVKNLPREEEGELVNYLVRNEKQNKSYAYDKEVPGSKKAILHYRLIGRSQNYYLLEIDLKTGRHHQIRCQLAKMGCPIKGDLKYGSPRSNPDGSICLHARYIRFVHPVSKEPIEVEAPVPPGNLWNGFETI
jgi:23S rRNA pseudouridine1911/1915/1917 synthase